MNDTPGAFMITTPKHSNVGVAHSDGRHPRRRLLLAQPLAAHAHRPSTGALHTHLDGLEPEIAAARRSPAHPHAQSFFE